MARAFIPHDSDPEFKLTKKFDDAWRADLALIREITRQEKQAEEDRALAASCAGITLEKASDDDRKLAMLLDDFDDDTDDEEEIKPVAVTTIATNSLVKTPTAIKYNSQPKEKKCAVCMESVRIRDPRAPCGHAYCTPCLKDLFNAAMQDETLMPPRCCRTEIPTSLVQYTPTELASFDAKRLEYSTKDRLYCSKPLCSTFIPPATIVDSIGTCPKPRCRATTCSICKAPSHGNRDCPKDEATAAVLEAAVEAGWKQCYQCRAMIELSHGCYHMTCRCRAEFCYLCSERWKTCTCKQWDDERLIEEARVRTARIPGLRTGQANTLQRIGQIADQLRANHECRHTNGWAYTRGGGTCDECGHYLPQYLFRCYQCHTMACNRCRHNRF